ncbi:hypothetical protein FQA39_LY14666 [Lamprigera yunnana]|nr:hypothetical protein FQA39_LY14666 [Lamprigera yunnana]
MEKRTNEKNVTALGESEPSVPVGKGSARVGPYRPLLDHYSTSQVGNQARVQEKATGTKEAELTEDMVFRSSSIHRTPSHKGSREDLDTTFVEKKDSDRGQADITTILSSKPTAEKTVNREEENMILVIRKVLKKSIDLQKLIKMCTNTKVDIKIASKQLHQDITSLDEKIMLYVKNDDNEKFKRKPMQDTIGAQSDIEIHGGDKGIHEATGYVVPVNPLPAWLVGRQRMGEKSVELRSPW